MGTDPVAAGLDERLVPRAVLDVLRELDTAGHQAWVVGGSVRDILRTQRPRPPKDWDVATSARPTVVQKLFSRVVPTGIKHGTVTVLTREGPVEVTTFRGETGYADARRPDKVEFLDRIEEDLARRDFTINAIAWNPLTGDVRDPFGGIGDLRDGVIRAVRDPMERFTEDGLRPMRAIRFASVLELHLDDATKEAIPRCLPSFRKVAIERIRQELEKILAARRPSVGLDLMRKLGLLGEVLPALAVEPEDVWTARLRAIDAAKTGLPVRLVLLMNGASRDIDPLLVELRFPGSIIAEVDRLASVDDWRSYALRGEVGARAVLARVGIDEREIVADMWRASAGSSEDESSSRDAEAFARLFLHVAASNPPVTARDLAMSGQEVMEVLGVVPGPIVGRAIAHLLDLVLEEPARNEPHRLREALARWKVSEGEGENG